jgi:hypothetical protein
VVLRFGMHWGANLYVGNITTAGRSEVTALGDEDLETATEKARRDAPAIPVCEV